MHKEPRLISDLSKLYSHVNKRTYQLQENFLIYTQREYVPVGTKKHIPIWGC